MLILALIAGCVLAALIFHMGARGRAEARPPLDETSETSETSGDIEYGSE
jgi:hypothetical protein